MNCTKCGYTLRVSKSDTSRDGHGKKYDREVYICSTDDIWITVETPQETTDE